MAVLVMTDRHKAMAYVLSREFGYSMVRIAKLMDVSQSTISNAIKDFEYQRVIRGLENELVEARNLLAHNGITPPVINLNH